MSEQAGPRPRELQELDVGQCLQLLDSTYLGRVAFIRDGRPTVLPVNYVLHEGSVVFRIGYGTALDDVIGSWVAFEADDVDTLYRTGWSVVVHGAAEEVWRPEDLDSVRALPLRPWAPGDREHYVRILSTAVTGRRIA